MKTSNLKMPLSIAGAKARSKNKEILFTELLQLFVLKVSKKERGERDRGKAGAFWRPKDEQPVQSEQPKWRQPVYLIAQPVRNAAGD